jgi:hypothetical protein
MEQIGRGVFFARLRHSQTGAELTRLLENYTATALSEFIGYLGDDPAELWRLRGRWQARRDFQYELEAEGDTAMGRIEEIATDLNVNPEDLELRSLFDGDQDPGTND